MFRIIACIALVVFASRIAAQDIDLQATYTADLAGVWSGQGHACDDLVGTWAFDTGAIRGNASLFDIDRIDGTNDRLVVQTTRRDTGTGARLVLTRTGDDTLAIAGPGFAADVIRCAPSASGLSTVPYVQDDSSTYDAATFKPVVLNGLICGADCVVDYTEQREGSPGATALCRAPECADWIDRLMIPTGFQNIVVGARVEGVPQRGTPDDAETTKVAAITAFGPPDTRPDTRLLPLPTGTYIDPSFACDTDVDGVARDYDGQGLSQSTQTDCDLYLSVRQGDVYRGIQTCTDPADQSDDTKALSVIVTGTQSFTLVDQDNSAQAFRLCK